MHASSTCLAHTVTSSTNEKPDRCLLLDLRQDNQHPRFCWTDIILSLLKEDNHNKNPDEMESAQACALKHSSHSTACLGHPSRPDQGKGFSPSKADLNTPHDTLWKLSEMNISSGAQLGLQTIFMNQLTVGSRDMVQCVQCLKLTVQSPNGLSPQDACLWYLTGKEKTAVGYTFIFGHRICSMACTPSEAL